MGIEPFLIASTVRAVVGQRLVRKLCVDCREVYVPEDAILAQISEIFGTNDAGIMKQIHDLETEALAAGIGQTNTSKTNKESPAELSTTPSKITKLWRVHDGGCESCGHIGYKGRMGIYEVLGSSAKIQDLIVSNSTSEIIQDQAIKDGMIIMQIDGFIKALRGQTTIEEILRVTAEK